METRRSAWAEMTIIKVLLCWLIVPIIIANVVAKNYRVVISGKTIKIYSGVFNKRTTDYAVAGITNINVYQSFLGRIFGYGDVNISIAGDKQVTLSGVLSPELVEIALRKKLLKTADATHVLTN